MGQCRLYLIERTRYTRLSREAYCRRSSHHHVMGNHCTSRRLLFSQGKVRHGYLLLVQDGSRSTQHNLRAIAIC